MNKNSDLVQKVFLWGWLGTVPNSKCFQTFEIVRNESSYTKLIFRLYVNIDKTNSRRYDVIW